MRRSRLPFLLVLALGLCTALAAAAQDDEMVKEFAKYFKKYKDTPTRVEAVLALENNESPKVVDALVEVVDGAEPDVRRAVVRVLGRFETRPPVDTLLAELERNKREGVRLALLDAIATGGYAGAEPIVAALLSDKSWVVRRQALTALARSAAAPAEGAFLSEDGGQPAAQPEAQAEPLDVPATILPLCLDSEPAVRCAAFDALALLASPLVVEPALAALVDPVWQVRASAVAALGVVRRRESIAPLIERMALEEGRLVADIGNALGEITGRGFGQRLESWQKFWATFGDRFQIPTDEELAKLREAQARSREKYVPPGAVSYYGIDSPSRRILFVIDVSGSMESEVVERERFQSGDYPSMLRIDIVKTELMRTIENLEAYVEFNVLAFATDVTSWKKSLAPANVLSKSSAIDWVGRLQAIGGASKQDLASAGLVGSANLEAGKTNTYAALMAALGVDPGARRDEYSVAVDTVFFLSDGRPSHGDYVDTDDILREVRAANQARKVVIHTIALGEFQKEFMRQLAGENGGVFVDLGR
ncbi:MAG TPA: HEAT repeat domain-containing protein [Planctomycetota bacterium]|nr:HEAT repeat domain-containing protein [Planctomycetota bacterium]